MGGLEPSKESQHITRYDPDGAVVANDHILDPSTLRCSDRCRRRTQIVAAAAGDVDGQSPLDIVQRNLQAHHPQRQPQRLPNAAHLAEAADKVGEHEQPDPCPAVVRRHRGHILQHQPKFAGAVAGSGARPAEVVQVEQREWLAPLLKQVGDLLGYRTLTDP